MQRSAGIGGSTVNVSTSVEGKGREIGAVEMMSDTIGGYSGK